MTHPHIGYNCNFKIGKFSGGSAIIVGVDQVGGRVISYFLICIAPASQQIANVVDSGENLSIPHSAVELLSPIQPSEPYSELFDFTNPKEPSLIPMYKRFDSGEEVSYFASHDDGPKRGVILGFQGSEIAHVIFEHLPNRSLQIPHFKLRKLHEVRDFTNAVPVQPATKEIELKVGAVYSGNGFNGVVLSIAEKEFRVHELGTNTIRVIKK